MSEQAKADSATGYRVLARKYRPKTFADLIGQEALVRTLTNAFATGRIAQAYMLTGVRGVGKTTTARLIARALNYPSGASVDMPEMTQQCEAILESRHMDVIEMDAASNTGVDNMREIIDSVRYAPVQARTKVYIIDEVHMLSKSAFNALLKTLEEPPPHVKFIFATTEIRKVPVTILSRCQRFDLKRMDAGILTDLYSRISKLENVEADEEALRLIARAAEGSARDGLSLLDQAMAYGEGKVKFEDVAAMLGVIDRTRVIELFDAVMAGEPAKALDEMNLQFQAGGDPQTMLTDLADFVHWVTRLKIVPKSAQQDTARTSDEKTRGSAYAAKLSIPHLARAWTMLLKGIQETAQAAKPEQAAEMVLIRLAHAADLPMGDDLEKLVQDLKLQASVSTIRRENPAPTGGPAPSRASNLAAAVQHSPASPPPQAPQSAPVALSTFSDIIALASDRRDIKLKNELERFIRPISMRDGILELALESGASPGLPGELSRKLELWTGRRWMVTVARGGGEETVAKQKHDARNSAERDALEMPDVKAIMKLFPQAKILEVRGLDMPLTTDPQLDIHQDDTDEESH